MSNLFSVSKVNIKNYYYVLNHAVVENNLDGLNFLIEEISKLKTDTFQSHPLMTNGLVSVLETHLTQKRLIF